MEDGQKVQIPLDSMLDVHSSDMLVSVQRPEFQHNRQQYQGKYMPSSLRFEHDGWAAGWDVYQFEFSEATTPTTPAGYIVSKQKIYDTPTYRLSVLDDNHNELGSVFFNNENNIKTNSTPAAIDSGVNPHITGTINGKAFDLAFDSLHPTNKPVLTGNKDITWYNGAGFNMSKNYTASIQLQDNSLSVDLTFDGVIMPTDIVNIRDKGYLLGKFLAYSSGVSTWTSDVYTFTVEGNTLHIESDTFSKDVIITDNMQDGTYINSTATFTVPLYFIDNPNCFVTDFYPFFSNVTYNSNYKTVQMLAQDTLEFNTWNGSVSDVSRSQVTNKLYRNFVSHGAPANTFNKQTILQRIPVWFGIYAKPGLIGDITGATTTDYAGRVLAERNQMFRHALEPDRYTYRAVISVKTTNNVLKYNKNVYRPNIKVFEQTLDKTDKYISSTGSVTEIPVTITYRYKWAESTEGGSVHFVYRPATMSLTLTSEYYDLNKLTEALTAKTQRSITPDEGEEYDWQDYDDPDAIKDLTISYAQDSASTTISGNWLKTSGTITTNNGVVTITPPVLKEQITANGFNYYEQLTGATAFWGRACYGYIASDLYLSEEYDTLTSANVSNALILTKHTDSSYRTNDKIWLDDDNKGTAIFTHKTGIINVLDNVELYIYTCASANNIFMLYSKSNYTTDILSYCPGHIITGNLQDVSNSSIGNMEAYSINKSYSAGDIDNNYSLMFSISCAPAKTDAGKLYNYIEPGNITPVFNIDMLFPGNKFTDTIVHELINSLNYSVDTWQGYFDFNGNIDEANFINNKQIINFATAKMAYALNNTLPIAIIPTYTYDGYTISLSISTNDVYTPENSIMQQLKITHTIQNATDNYNVQFKRLWVNNATTGKYGTENNTFKLLSYIDNVLTFKDSRFNYRVNYNTYEAFVSFDSSNYVEASEEFYSNNAVRICSIYYTSIIASILGVYDSKNMTVTGLTSTTLTFKYNDVTYSIDITSNGLFNPNYKSWMYFKYTDTRKPELEAKRIQKVDTEKEMQFLKQQWDTTIATENFWWVDSTHILVLTKTSLILRSKTDILHDWNGNVFTDEQIWERSDFISSDDIRYMCTSAYNGEHARFITFRLNGTYIQLNIYDPLNNMSATVFNISLIKRELGTKLLQNAKALYTYSELNLHTFISRAKLSATCITDKLIVGIHYDNNFNQWAIIYDLSRHVISQIVQGYGYVGIDGRLTGGEIPVEFFDANGFNDTVKPLSALDKTSKNIANISELYSLESQVVGNEAQQWYISKQITGIVSHLTYNSDINTFTVHTLPLNNNYAIRYESASFYSTVFSDFLFKVTGLNDLIPGSGGARVAWTAMLSVMMWPMMYYLNPKITVANYLQQTIGQAAYVHYNNTTIRQQKEATDTNVNSNTANSVKVKGTAYGITVDRKFDPQEPIMSDELSFDRQSVSQSASCEDPYTNLFSICAAALISATEFLPPDIRVNKPQNQEASDDKGKKYTQSFLQNINSMIKSNMTLRAVNPTLNSEVTAVKTLDMFYSTSDTQQIYAGPGYVQHNFVAQCVAQSVTSAQVAVRQQKMMLAIKQISIYQLQIAHKLVKLAADKLKNLADVNKEGIVGSMPGAITNPGTIVGTIQKVAGFVLDAAQNAISVALETIPELIDAIAGGKMTSTITGDISLHDYNIEGKHRYGSKSETYMWPCFGINAAQTVVDESVEVVTQNKSWKLDLKTSWPRIAKKGTPSFVTQTVGTNISEEFYGDVPYYIAMLKGKQTNVTLPDNMAYVIGTESFLPNIDFKNENIGESDPVFTRSMIQDYIIDSLWQIGTTVVSGMQAWVSCKDTKILDGAPSNMVISSDFCGIASTYTAIEIKRGISKDYIRPWAVTPQVLALNNTGFNCCYDEKAYHAFDGYGQRITSWLGSAGMSKQRLIHQYTFIVNDRLKRSNKTPNNEYLGNFKADPNFAITTLGEDTIYNAISVPDAIDNEAGPVGENKNVIRYALPVFSEFVNTLPSAVKTVSSYNLSVVDGITSLTSENRDLQVAYKAPVSIDFAIGKKLFRFTNEYICSLTQENGLTIIEDIVPCLGLDFLGATPYEAYFYSQATRQYYTFNGNGLMVIDMLERFRNIINGRYDFVNQEVDLPCIATFLRLDNQVKDDTDETDNVIIPRLKDKAFIGEINPPIDTIFNTRSWFRTISLPCGVTYQGPNRCIINRFVYSDYMLKQIKDNYGKWKRVHRENYHPFRKYAAKYEKVTDYLDSGIYGVMPKGWTHNPFLLVTAPLGVQNETDCLFEWEVTFTWPVEMDKLYAVDNYATVMLQAETMTPGGKVIADRPTHIYLTKELFTRTGNYGYYSFRYQSKCGAGNRERLHIWSDQYICVSALQVEFKPITQKRNEILTQHVDVQRLVEI